MRSLFALLLSLGTSACGFYFPGSGDDEGEGGAPAEDVYVAVGDQGALLSSDDAVTWTTRTGGTSVALSDVAFGGERYVAVGQAGTILESSNGVDWRTASSPSSRDLNAVVHHIDRFYAVGGDASAGAETLVSFDGVTWTRPEITPPLHVLTDLASDGSDLVAIGTYQGSAPTFGLFAWQEGTGWDQRIDGTGLSLGYVAVAAGAPSFAIIGLGGSASTDDTVDWTQAPIFTPEAMRGLAFTQAGWLAVGDAGQTLQSNDATAWVAHPTGAAIGLRGVATSGSLHVAVGAAGTIFTTGDGVTWTQQTSPTTANLRAVTHPRS